MSKFPPHLLHLADPWRTAARLKMLSGWLEVAAEPSSLQVVWFHKSNSVIDSRVRSDMCWKLGDSGKVDPWTRWSTKEKEMEKARREAEVIKAWVSWRRRGGETERPLAQTWLRCFEVSSDLAGFNIPAKGGLKENSTLYWSNVQNLMLFRCSSEQLLSEAEWWAKMLWCEWMF